MKENKNSKKLSSLNEFAPFQKMTTSIIEPRAMTSKFVNLQNQNQLGLYFTKTILGFEMYS